MHTLCVISFNLAARLRADESTALIKPIVEGSMPSFDILACISSTPSAESSSSLTLSKADLRYSSIPSLYHWIVRIFQVLVRGLAHGDVLGLELFAFGQPFVQLLLGSELRILAFELSYSTVIFSPIYDALSSVPMRRLRSFLLYP